MKTKIDIYGTKNQILVRELKRHIQKVLTEKNNHAKRLSIILVDNNYIRKLNRKYLRRNRITDVLAFTFDDEFLGEVYVCRERAKKQAREYGLTEKEEIFRLAKHGVTHLLGYHH